MAATTAGYHEWSASPPLRHSPDTPSSMFPDRPIRPLPKRRLRARLSPEQAESIIFPPAPPSSGSLFSFPYSPAESRASVRVGQRRGEHDHHTCTCGANHEDIESEEEEDEGATGLPSSPTRLYSKNYPGRPAGGGGYPKPGSTASSADGYESFENTNNKKKRKIPNMGSTAQHHSSSLSAEMASMGISHARELAHEDGEHGAGYYGSGPSTPQHSSAGTGIAGAGRGRFGRAASGRQERRVLGTSSSSLANAKAGGKRASEQAGIISTAIANAQATPSPTSNENVSLLQQEASKNSASKSQFTFTCGSDSAMAWPGAKGGHPQTGLPQPSPPGPYPPSVSPSTGGPPPSNLQPQVQIRPPVRHDAPAMVSTQGTQTSPKMNGAPHAPSAKSQQQQKPSHGGQQAQPPPRKPRRSAAKMYQYAARHRQMQQAYTNFHNPPKPEEVWICEFCEYEAIFGVQPLALIRQYEIKDRQERKRAAEKKRLLEKARMKGRKGKKASKKAQNPNNTNQHAQNPPSNRYDEGLDDAPLDDAAAEELGNGDDYSNHLPPPHVKQCDHAACNAHHPHCPRAVPARRAPTA